MNVGWSTGERSARSRSWFARIGGSAPPTLRGDRQLGGWACSRNTGRKPSDACSSEGPARRCRPVGQQPEHQARPRTGSTPDLRKRHPGPRPPTTRYAGPYRTPRALMNQDHGEESDPEQERAPALDAAAVTTTAMNRRFRPGHRPRRKVEQVMWREHGPGSLRPDQGERGPSAEGGVRSTSPCPSHAGMARPGVHDQVRCRSGTTIPAPARLATASASLLRHPGKNLAPRRTRRPRFEARRPGKKQRHQPRKFHRNSAQVQSSRPEPPTRTESPGRPENRFVGRRR